jgi:predicted 3-demethylubiquinone-9 3-methyltransferase (glyoxalase superfamily)
MATPKAAASAVTAKDDRTQTQPQKITTFLWFDGNADEAVNFYTSVFKNSKIIKKVPYTAAGPGPEGSIMVIDFELEGQRFTALNGGPEFKFNESISQLVHCSSQAEVDYYWEKLGDGGQYIECGWLKDKFGLAWQITPDVLLELIADPDREKANRAMKAMMTMKKIDIAEIERAANQKG